MAIDTKYGTGIVELNPTVSISREGAKLTTTTTRTFTGPYGLLKSKLNSQLSTAQSANLTPDDAGHGTLTITTEQVEGIEDIIEEEEEEEESGGNQQFEIGEGAPPPVYELVWQELRLPVEQHPYFKEVGAIALSQIEAALAGDGPPPTEGPAAELYTLRTRGVTEYATGVPVVRETRSGFKFKPSAGNAWIRDAPSGGGVGPSGWEWMKTAHEVRNDGRTWSVVQEWTGAKEWDSILYPS